MATQTRSQKINKMLKVLASTYQPVSPVDRPVLEHLLYACCLENSMPEAADETFARLQELYFDWNEVRVTSVRELEEVMAPLCDAAASASRLTQCLQSIFETQYNFDLEPLRKINQGKAVAELQKINGATSFAVQYVVQHALGGHSIPISQGVLEVLHVLGIVSDAEAKAGRAPGLERAIPKNKGPEMASLIHQLGTDFRRSPFSTKVRDTILKIEPEARQRLPKRTKKKTDAATAKTGSKSSARRATKSTGSRTKKTAASSEKSETGKKRSASSRTTKKTPARKKSPAAKKGAGRSSTAKKSTTKSASKSASKSLARRKPR